MKILAVALYTLMIASLSCITTPSYARENYKISLLKLNQLFQSKINDKFEIKKYAGQWLSPARADQIYPGSCATNAEMLKFPSTQVREIDLAPDASNYQFEGGAHMNISMANVGGTNVLIDKAKRYSLGANGGCLTRDSNGLEFCIVIKPEEMKLIAAEALIDTPKADFMVCKRPENGSRNPQFALRDACGWYYIYTRNH